MNRPPQPFERAIYVPKGRRQLNASSVGTTSSNSHDQEQAVQSKKRPAQEEEVNNNSVDPPIRNNKPARCDTVQKDKARMESSQQRKPKPIFGETGIYVPKGRRALNQQKVSEEPLKAINNEPAKSKVQCTNNTANCANSNNGKVVSSSSSNSGEVHTPSPVDEATALSNLDIGGGNEQAKPKEVVRGIYIPKGRRELNEKKAQEVPAAVAAKATATADKQPSAVIPRSEEEPPISKRSEFPSSSSSRQMEEDGECVAPESFKAKLAPYTDWDDESSSDEEFIPFSRTEQATPPPPPPPSVEETIAACTLLLAGVPAEMSDMAKGNIIRTYLDKGASVKWVSVGECVIVFKTEKAAISAIPGPGTSIFRVVRVRDMAQPRKDELVSVAKEYFVVVKPERDSTVANRLIGAALGIRIAPTKPANTDIANRNKPRAPSPPREDAWDD